jgi:hypothetical protein
MQVQDLKGHVGQKVRIVIYGGQFTYGGEVIENGHVLVKTRTSLFDVPPEMVETLTVVPQ